jgi:hypothetical protein
MKKPKPLVLDQVAQPGCPDLLEVVLFAPQGANESDFMLGADVRFGTMTVASEDWAKMVEIGLSTAILSLDLSGCEVDPAGHRFGDKPPVSAKTHLQRTQVATKSTDLGGKASTEASTKSVQGEIKLSAGLTKGSKVSSTETQVVDTRQEPVVAISNNRWKFSSVAEGFMQSRYSGHEALCKIEVKAPNVRVDGRLTFQPKDIVIVDVECASTALLERFRKSPNKAAIAKVLLAKHLREINPLPERAGAAITGCISTLKGDI